MAHHNKDPSWWDNNHWKVFKLCHQYIKVNTFMERKLQRVNYNIAGFYYPNWSHVITWCQLADVACLCVSDLWGRTSSISMASTIHGHDCHLWNQQPQSPTRDVLRRLCKLLSALCWQVHQCIMTSGSTFKLQWTILKWFFSILLHLLFSYIVDMGPSLFLERNKISF